MSDMSTNLHNQTETPHTVCILGFDDALLLDVAGPAQVFASANKVLGRRAYQISTVSQDGNDFTTDAGLTFRADMSFAQMAGSGDLIVPGGPGVDARIDDPVLQRFLKRMAPKTGRLASICSGSLLTAAAGLLEGRKATTHWERSNLAQKRFPSVDWEMDQIFTQDGKFYCSAGVTTGIDLTLSLVQADHGRRIALGVAREMVIFMQRQGGQSQYSAPLRAQATTSKRLADLYTQIEQDPAGAWSVARMAKIAHTTQRTLHRDFMHEFSQNPSQFVEERRLALARTYLESGRKSIKEIAALSGFVTEQKMRRSFVKCLGILPSEYKMRFGQVGRE